MFRLTSAQSEQINSAVYTHDYAAEAVSQYKSTGDDGTDVFTERFELETRILQRADSTDIGGLILYYRERELLAFYDYERFVGAVF